MDTVEKGLKGLQSGHMRIPGGNPRKGNTGFELRLRLRLLAGANTSFIFILTNGSPEVVWLHQNCPTYKTCR